MFAHWLENFCLFNWLNGWLKTVKTHLKLCDFPLHYVGTNRGTKSIVCQNSSSQPHNKNCFKKLPSIFSTWYSGMKHKLVPYEALGQDGSSELFKWAKEAQIHLYSFFSLQYKVCIAIFHKFSQLIQIKCIRLSVQGWGAWWNTHLKRMGSMCKDFHRMKASL